MMEVYLHSYAFRHNTWQNVDGFPSFRLELPEDFVSYP
jgi:hypothetical protein